MNGKFLAYYKSKKKEKLLAALNLIDTGVIEVEKGSNEDEKKVGLFAIELNSRRYILQAKTEEEALKWVNTLNLFKANSKSVMSADSGSVTSSLVEKHGFTSKDSDPATKTPPEIESGEVGSKGGEWNKSNRSFLDCSCCC